MCKILFIYRIYVYIYLYSEFVGLDNKLYKRHDAYVKKYSSEFETHFSPTFFRVNLLSSFDLTVVRSYHPSQIKVDSDCEGYLGFLTSRCVFTYLWLPGTVAICTLLE
jgi:hypothetical protein